MAKNNRSIKRMTITTKLPKRLFLFLLFIGSLVAIRYLPYKIYPLQTIKIFSTFQYLQQEEIRQAIQPHLTRGFFTIKIRDIKHSLCQIPWVYTAIVTRQWPGTLVIRLVEQEAKFCWQKTFLVNHEGVPFHPDPKNLPADLLQIDAPQNYLNELFQFYQISLTLLEPLDLKITAINYFSTHWQIIFNNRLQLLLRLANPQIQLKLFTQLYRKITANHQHAPQSIDLRYPSGMAVKW